MTVPARVGAEAARKGFVAFVQDWNRLSELSTPRHHRDLAAWLEERCRGHNRNMLLMAFRGAGKSSLVGLFAAWLLYDDPNRRLLVLAADLKLAKKMVRNVKRIIERHPDTAGLKPPARDRDQWAQDQFTVVRTRELRDPSMIASGIGGNITGSRADVVICDDVEVPRTSDSAVKRDDLREKLAEIEYVLVPGGAQLYVGTPHSYYTIYADEPRPEAGESVPFLDGFERKLLPVYTEDETGRRTYAWPKRFDEAQVNRMRKATGPNKFSSQMLLKPVNIAEGWFDPGRLGIYDGELDYRESRGRAVLTLNGARLASASCWWDPAFARPSAEGVRRGDSSVVAAVFGSEDGRFFLHRLRYLTVDAADEHSEAEQQCRQVAAFLRDHHLPNVRVEINGVGRFLPGQLRSVLRKTGTPAAVIEESSRKAKAERIEEAYAAILADNRLLAHRSVWSTPFIREMREWRPDGSYRGHDDGLDAVAGCLLCEPYRFEKPGAARPAAPGAGAVERPLGRPRPDWRGMAPVVAPSDWDV
ncbi:phage terminase large subunit [Azospirillum sp. SYSU D00513]|uniref:phage terminase large subunit n=1 Tax=Azospirillum sp. SYSU D00513 TaxID=2812561 RepID=UPI001A96073A|nr:phage terminase large subunit [Azospirillum sp. SYSU D00513]